MYHIRLLFCWFPHLTCIDIDADDRTYLGWYSSFAINPYALLEVGLVIDGPFSCHRIQKLGVRVS